MSEKLDVIACVMSWNVDPGITKEEVCAQLRERADQLESGKLALNNIVSVAKFEQQGNMAVCVSDTYVDPTDNGFNLAH